MYKRCDQCLYGPTKVVSDERKEQLQATLDRDDDYFICHKSTIAGKKVACHGDYTERSCGRVGRFCKHFDMIEFVKEDTL